MSAEFLLGLLDTLPLPSHYKTNHLLDSLANLPVVDLPDYVPDCVYCPEPVSLNVVNIQKIYMPSADLLPWHPDDNDPGY